MAVDGHHPLAVEALEEHAVAVVGRRDGLGLVHPRAVEGAALAVGHALRVVAEHPRRPEHAQPACARAEEPRTVRDLVPDDISLFVALAAPGGVAGSEEDARFAHGAAEVGFQLNLLHRAVPVLQPFAAEHHIGLAVGIAPEGAVERRTVGGQVGGVAKGTVGAHGVVGTQHLAGTPLDDVAPHGINLHGLVGEGGEVVVPVVACPVEFGCPYHRARPHPRVGVELRDAERPLPQLEVGRAPHHAACARHVVHSRCLVGQHGRVAETDGVRRHILPWLEAPLGHRRQRRGNRQHDQKQPGGCTLCQMILFHIASFLGQRYTNFRVFPT